MPAKLSLKSSLDLIAVEGEVGALVAVVGAASEEDAAALEEEGGALAAEEGAGGLEAELLGAGVVAALGVAGRNLHSPQ